jgi:signal transduction histidine kinase
MPPRARTLSRMRRMGRSIRWWLAMFALATVVPLLILVTWLFVSQVRREEQEARATAFRIARLAADRLGASFGDSVSLLERLAQRRSIRDFDGRYCDEMFGVIELFPNYADLFFFDTAGQLVCAADPQEQDIPVSTDARQWIAAELRRGALVPGKPLVGLVRGKWISAISREVRGAGGQPRGVLVLIDLLDIMGGTMPPEAVLTIVDGAGVVVARSSEPERWMGRNVSATSVGAAVLREREGSTAARGIDGTSRQYGFTTIPEVGWHLYVGLRTDELMHPVRALFARGLAGGAAILFAIVLTAILLARTLSRPINALARAAGAVAAGAYGKVEERHGPREIVTLAHSFNVMVERRAEAERRMAESERMLKALSDRLLVVQEEERTRIAREIHDDLGQSLTALKMDVLGLLAAPQPRDSPLRERIVTTLDSIVVAVQRIASELRPSLLDDLGLIAAVESEARLFEERTGIECELSLPDELHLAPDRAAAIYRIIQEALTNVARHSNASRVEVRIRPRPADLLVDIRDDGRGIEAAELDAPSSIGLIGMRERASLLGGTVTFEGFRGRGTIVSVCIPLPPDEGRES